VGQGSPLTLSFGAVTYGLAAAGFLVLTVLLLTSWEGRAQGMRLIVACSVTIAWATLLALGADRSTSGAPVALLSEFFRYGAWFFVLTGLALSAGMARSVSRLAHVAWIGAVILIVARPLLAGAGLPTPSPPVLLACAGLLLALIGLLLLEQIYRNAREGGRHAFKFLVIGLGLTFAYDLFLFSQALLLRAIEPATWQGRGLVTALTVPLLAIAARRNPQWSLNLFVSRHVVFYSSSFLVVGIYLLLMAAGGYWVRLHGGAWGPAAQFVFVAGAAVVLIAVMASSSLRRRLRVFLNQHFYRNKYDYRLEWLRFVHTLSMPFEGVDARANALRAMAQVINSPSGVLYLRTEDGEAFAHAASWPSDEFDLRRHESLPSHDELIEFLSERQWVIDLAELRAKPGLYGNLFSPAIVSLELGDEPGRSRLIVPLTHVDALIGFVVLAAPPEPFEPNYEDRDLLKMMGRHVAVHIAQFDTDRRLAESRQFEAYNRLTAFVMHDLRNLAAQLALIVSNAEQHKRNPQFVDDAIGTIANSTERMQRLIDQLQRREMQGRTKRISPAEVARRACERCNVRRPAPQCGEAVEDVWVEADPERLTMIVEHVIRNAQDATPEDGSVVLSVSLDGIEGALETAVPMGETSQIRVPTVALTVSDTGAGMTAEFIRERLFKPFDTTKGSKGMGIGAYQVREYVKSLGGRVDVASRVGHGTRIALRIPLAAPPPKI
jgi:putative PEP-CTERM system histidine kinase